MVHISDIIFILFWFFCAYLLVNSTGDKEREDYLERIRLLKKAINNKGR